MGTDDLFKKRRSKLQERAKETRIPKPNSFLIVSEGEKTEPNYFDGLAHYIDEKYGRGPDVEKPIITACGRGRCTVALVEEAARIVARATIRYSQVWVVFDKDNFDDFDDAIALANKYGYRSAWSNESFEYWIYLHFSYSDSALGRDDWVKKLDRIFREYGIDENGYKKNNPNIFKIATTHGSLKSAVGSAIRIYKSYPPNAKPSLCNPCTQVHNLILELKPYLEELL